MANVKLLISPLYLLFSIGMVIWEPLCGITIKLLLLLLLLSLLLLLLLFNIIIIIIISQIVEMRR